LGILERGKSWCLVEGMGMSGQWCRKAGPRVKVGGRGIPEYIVTSGKRRLQVRDCIHLLNLEWKRWRKKLKREFYRFHSFR
jgi:hypothetical protein